MRGTTRWVCAILAVGAALPGTTSAQQGDAEGATTEDTRSLRERAEAANELLERQRAYLTLITRTLPVRAEGVAETPSCLLTAAIASEDLVEAPMPRPDADRQTFAGTCSRLLESIRERIEEQEEETLRLYRELARERTERLDRIIRVGNREYRLTTALGFVEFNVSRRADEPARARNYEPGLRLAPSLSFLVLFRPCQWRFAREDGAVCPEAGRPEGETIQIASLGLSLVLAVGENVVPRFGLGAVMLFFDDIVGFSVGVDLYRAIPVLESGRSTFAHTGLLAAAAATEGEVTPENFWIGLILNVESLLSVLQGGRP